ncbi:hypothetical protein CCACVL1_16833 [Corchorus capsularis]|uniref:Uncharacterized protein n=1 Tax=Corchorus capsularis TaxID=210143 RepID=A0A1R3HVT8_COCAP|nr:hypothetical protein CCACVL1_16833 [Corchorus capsularis]
MARSHDLDKNEKCIHSIEITEGARINFHN